MGDVARARGELLNDLSKVRVLVVDDHEPWRRFATAQLKRHSITVVGTAANGRDAVEEARALKPDIILMDLWMPWLNGLEATRQICGFDPAAKILIITNDTDPQIVQAALTAGARGYTLKSMAGTELLKAIEAVIRGDLFVSVTGP